MSVSATPTPGFTPSGNPLTDHAVRIWGIEGAPIHAKFTATQRTVALCVNFDDGLERFCHAALAPIGIAQIVACSHELAHREPIGSKNVMTVFTAADATVSAVRVVGTVSEIASLRFFFDTDEQGVRTRRHVLEITMSVSIAVGRVGSFVNFGHNLKLWELSEHSQKTLGIVNLAAFSICSAAFIGNEIRKFHANPTINNGAGIVNSVAEGLALTSGVLYSTFSQPEFTASNPNLGPGLGIFAGIMYLFSFIAYFIKDWISTRIHPGLQKFSTGGDVNPEPATQNVL